MDKKILLVVDTQYDFMMSDGRLYVPGAEEIVVPLIKYVQNTGNNGFEYIYFTYDTHEAEEYANSAEGKMFPLHCEEGTSGHENVINTLLIPDDLIDNTVIHYKPVFDMWEEEEPTRDAFWDTKTDYTVYVCGVATDVCVLQAVRGLLDRGFKVVVLEDLTRGIIENALEYLTNECAAEYETGQLKFERAFNEN